MPTYRRKRDSRRLITYFAPRHISLRIIAVTRYCPCDLDGDNRIYRSRREAEGRRGRRVRQRHIRARARARTREPENTARRAKNMGALTRERVLVRLVARFPAHSRVIVRRILPYQLFWKTTPFFSPAGQFVTYRAHGDALALPCRVPRHKRDGRFTASAIYFAAVLSENASERHRYPRDVRSLAPRESRVSAL